MPPHKTAKLHLKLMIPGERRRRILIFDPFTTNSDYDSRCHIRAPRTYQPTIVCKVRDDRKLLYSRGSAQCNVVAGITKSTKVRDARKLLYLRASVRCNVVAGITTSTNVRNDVKLFIYSTSTKSAMTVDYSIHVVLRDAMSCGPLHYVKKARDVRKHSTTWFCATQCCAGSFTASNNLQNDAIQRLFN